MAGRSLLRKGAAFLAILLLFLPAAVQAQFNYTTNDGKITITGYTGAGGAVIIPSTISGLPVAFIGDSAFSGCSDVTSVSIPNSVTNIGNWAFDSCSLTSVTLGSGVTNIGEGAFEFCFSLASVMIPNSVRTIGPAAFMGCNVLASVTIGSSVSTIGDSAFASCYSLPRITIPNSVTNIGIWAFDGCSGLTSVTMGSGVVTIGDGAFDYCTSLASVMIPNSVKTIGSAAFMGCDVLTSVTIGSGVSTIGDVAFANCYSLLGITIPNSVTNIGNWAFDGCSGLTSVTMGSGVVTIGDGAFDYCTSLASVTIPNSVKTIGAGAFLGCDVLASVTIGSGVTTIGDEAFASCYSLPRITIPNSVTRIGAVAFAGCGITNVTVGSGVTNIGDYAFANSTKLKGVYFQGDAPAIGESIFTGDGSATVYYLWGTSGWGPTFGGRPTVMLTLPVRLVVSSAYAGAVPPTGTNILTLNSNYTAVVTNSPRVFGTTQYVCRGWTGTGSVPPTGDTTDTGLFKITNDSTVAWLWTTNYWLDTATNGNGSVNVEDGWQAKGSNVQITGTAVEHFRFTGWSGRTNGCTFSSNVITAPMTMPRAITANFAMVQHSLMVTTRYGKGNPPAGTNWYNWDSLVTAAITNSPVTAGNTQYVCGGWSGTGSVPPGGAGANTGPFNLTNNSSIAWLWTTNFWLNTATNGNGTVDTPDQWRSFGDNVLITATPSFRSRFTRWTGQTNGCVMNSNQITVAMSSPRQITANFTSQYSLAVFTPHGHGTPPLGTNWFDGGTLLSAKITNSPVVDDKTQYVCRGWTGTGNVPASGATTNTAVFTNKVDSTIAWLWRTNYWLDVDPAGGGSLSTGDCWLALGTNIQVVATPSNHWRFAEWSGDTNGCTMTSNRITVLMDRPRAITAAFVLDQHSLLITTPYGQGFPPAGTNWLDYLTVTNASVVSPVTDGQTQYICIGWAGSGSVPASGTATSTPAFTLTNNSTLAWTWRTNYWLEVGVEGSGGLNVTSDWFAQGISTQVTATEAAYFHFSGWTGQTNGCAFTGNRITALVDGPRRITAVFSADLASNNVPKWWLAGYGLTNFDADATNDIDRDGFFTWQEWVAGTDPTNDQSFFRFEQAGNIAAAGLVIRWPSQSNRFYSVSRSTNLLGGPEGFVVIPGAGNLPGTPAENSYTDQVEGVGLYIYQIGVHE